MKNKLIRTLKNTNWKYQMISMVIGYGIGGFFQFAFNLPNWASLSIGAMFGLFSLIKMHQEKIRI